MNAYDKLKIIQDKNNSLLSIGLDTDIMKVPNRFKESISGLFEFNKKIIDATHDVCSCYKINFAFYEQYGCEGVDVLRKTFEYIPKENFTIADAKRADIGNTSNAYSAAIYNYFKADSITIHSYMGYDSVSPFLKYEDKIAFLLTLTSNPGSNDFQRLTLEGKPLYRHIMEKSLSWAGFKQLGFVIGATHPAELEELRDLAPQSVFLIPGIGAQGGDIEAVIKANASRPAIINVSRDIIYSSNDYDFAEKAREKAIGYNKFLKYKK